MTAVRTSVANALSVTLFAAYPLAVYILLGRGELRLAGLALLAAVGMRALRPGSTRLGTVATLGVGALFAVAVVISSSETLARLYPVAISAVLLGAFGATLLRPPSMVERIARGTGAELDADGTLYTRAVTIVWCGFFLVNGSIALVTALFASREVWVLYNGFVSYVIVAALFVGERVARSALRRRAAQPMPH